MKNIKWQKFISTIEHQFYKETQVDNMTNLEQDALDSFNLHDEYYSNASATSGLMIIDEGGVLIPVNEAKMPRKHYNLWIGHTNFPLRNGIDDEIIASFLGITSFSWINTYSFRIGIGKNFDALKIRQSIEAFYQGKPYAKIQGLNEVQRYTIIAGKTQKEVEKNIALCEHPYKDQNVIIKSWVNKNAKDIISDFSNHNDRFSSKFSDSELSVD